MYFQYKKISNLLIVALLSLNLPVMASKLYKDIPDGHWSETAADVLGEENIMGGASTNEFGGNLTLNRYDVARIINGLMGNRSIPTSIILLSDIRSGHPDFRTIMKILSAGLMDTSSNKFNGEKKVSRYDFANFMIKTLNYLQADSISIRQPPKTIGNITAEKREVINKAVNFWQLTDGYNDWDQNINRYGALEMVSKAAININPDLLVRIGNVVRSNTGENPTKTPVPVKPTSNPTPVATPYPTAIPYTPDATPSVNPYPTTEPMPYPTIEPSKPEPILSVVPSITPTQEPIATPIPLKTPVIVTPTTEPTSIPSSVPTPEITPPPNIAFTGNSILRSQFTLRGIYNFMYSETIPSFPITIEPVRTHDDTLGLAVNAELSYWLKDIDIPVVKDMGIIANVNTLGSYAYPKETAIAKIDTLINETFRVNLSALYKLVKTNDVEVATGLDMFYRGNSRESQKVVVDSYWRASKSYIGIGAKALLGWRPMEKFVVEASFAGHYVSQTINEKITYGGSATTPVTPAPGASEGNSLDRFDVEFGLGGRYDIFQIGSNWLYVDLNLNGRFLLGEGSQTIVGGGGGVGISF